MKLQFFKKEFTLFKNAFLLVSFLFLSTSTAYSQCSYPNTATQVGTDYTFCIDNQQTFTTDIVNAGSYVVVNVVKGFKYTFSVGNVFNGGNNENLTLFNATTNVNLGAAGYVSGGSGATISNWTATLSGKIKVLLSKGSCLNDNLSGGALTLTLNSIGNTQDNQTLSGLDKWVGHVYNWTGAAPPGGTTSPATPSISNPFINANYVGYYNIASETINEGFGSDATCFEVTSAATKIYTQTFAVRYRMRSTKTGYYTLNVSGDDGIRVYVDGVLVFDAWKEQSSTNYCNNLIYLKGNSDIVFDYYENGGQNTVTFGLTAFLPTTNAIDGDAIRNVCSGTSPGTLVGSAYDPCAGSKIANVTFQWQVSSDNVNFSDIADATSRNYAVPAITTTTNEVRYYRRIVKQTASNGANPILSSNVIQVNTSPTTALEISDTISGTIWQCTSLTGQVYSITAVANALNYNWTVPTGWTITGGQGTNAITVTTGTTGQNGNISVTASNGCKSITKTLPVNVNVPTPLGDNKVSYTNGISGQVNGTVAEDATMTLTAPAGTYFAVVNFASYGTPTGSSPNFVISSCHSITSHSVTETYLLGNTGSITIPATNAVYGDPCVGTGKNLRVLASYAQTICSGTNVIINGTIPTGGTGNFTYQWQSSTTSATAGFAAATGTNNAINYTTAALTQTTWFRRVVTSCSESSTSAVVLVKVTPKTIPTFAQVASVCNGETISALPTTSTNGITGTWSPALNNTATTTYTFTPTTGLCAATATMTITVGGTTTWSGTSWNPSAPTAGITAIISGNYSENADITACSLTVTNNAIVTIPSGKNVTLDGKLTVTPGSSFTLSNNANLIQKTDVANSGNITVKRNSNPLMRLDYTMWSAPVTGQGLYAFSPNTFANRFYTYNALTDLYNAISTFNITGLNSNGVNGTDANDVKFGLAMGYLIRMPWNHPTTPTIWEGNFTGVPNNGPVTLNGLTTAKYYAVGNPFPSTLNADKFITDNAITEAIYFWRKTNNSAKASYATYTKAGGVGTAANVGDSGDPLAIKPNGIIQVGQGFIVKTTNTNLQFNKSQRISNNSNQFLRNAQIERNRIWLNLSKEGVMVNQMMVAYMTGATEGIDAAIDGRYFNDNPTALNSLINNEEFAIQGRSLPFDATDIVPLSFKATTAGTYTIAIDQVDGLFEGSQLIYLRDAVTGIDHNLKAGSYNFATEAGTFANRFSLVYTSSTLSVGTPVLDANAIVIYKNETEAFEIHSGAVTMASVKIFDIRGRLLASLNNINSNQATINAGEANEVLLVQVTSAEGATVTKKVIR